MTAMTNPARERLAKGEVSLGVGLRQARTVDIAPAMKTAGYDWLFIDLEHGVFTLENASQLSLAALGAGIAPLVRVPSGQFSMGTRALDCGAWGLIIPHVDTPEQARELVQHFKYAPEGQRSIGPASPQLNYMSAAKGAAQFNREMTLVAMIETPEAVANADAIAAVPGIDVLLIGTNDLGFAMGLPGDMTHERIIDAYKKVIAACNKHGKVASLGGVYDDVLIPKYLQLGFKMALVGTDMLYMLNGAKARREVLRGVAP